MVKKGNEIAILILFVILTTGFAKYDIISYDSIIDKHASSHQNNFTVDSSFTKNKFTENGGMIHEKDVATEIPGDEIVIKTDVATIAISRYGFRFVKWYDNTTNTEMSANMGTSSAGGDVVTKRYPFWGWITNQPWTGELWDAYFEIITNESNDIATISGSYTFNSTYEGTSSDLAGLEAVSYTHLTLPTN